MLAATTSGSISTNSWIGDGSRGSTFSVNNNGELTVSAAKRGTPFAVRSSKACFIEAVDGDGGGDNNENDNDNDLFSFTMVSGGVVSVGLVSPEEFRPGWKTRGMFYNGNITNGSCAKIVGAGTYTKLGDEIAVRISKRQQQQEEEEQHNRDDPTTTTTTTTTTTALEVEFLVNGKSIGTAFRLGAEQSSKRFFPCVTTDGTSTVLYKDKQATLRGWATTATTPANDDDDSYEGTWKIESLSVGGATVDLGRGAPIITFALTGKPDPTTIAIRVINTMRGFVRVTGRGGKKKEEEDAIIDVIITGGMQTRVGSSPEMMRLEDSVFQGVTSCTTMRLVTRNHLSMTGPPDGTASAAVEITARRYTKTFRPLTKY